MELSSLVLVLPQIDADCVVGVRRIKDATFERPLQSGESVPVEVIVQRAGRPPSEVELLAGVLCRSSEAPRRALNGGDASTLDDSAPAVADPYADDLECVTNIPV